MNRHSIDIIESLYPIDSPYGTKVAWELFKQAAENTHLDWRQLPEDFLREYARLCERKENGTTKRLLEKDSY